MESSDEHVAMEVKAINVVTSYTRHLQVPFGTVIAKVLNRIPRFHIVHINTTAFLFMV